MQKPTLPKILRDNTAIVLYNVSGEVYCSDANSTAFKFPLIDANILESAPACHDFPLYGCPRNLQYLHGNRAKSIAVHAGDDGPAVQVPLDGTVYELETGKVGG